jgi:hypothetical protein
MRAVRPLHGYEPAGLCADEALRGGPCVVDDAENRTSPVRICSSLELCFNLPLRAFMWIQNVTLFENLEAIYNLWNTNWVTEMTLLLEAGIMFYVQLFFCHRLWVSIFCFLGYTLFAQSVPRQYLITSTLWSSP